jgi:hypothetical protein
MNDKNALNIRVEENKRRLDKYYHQYNPYTGDARSFCTEREKVSVFGNILYLPVEFIRKEHKLFSIIGRIEKSKTNQFEFFKLRLKYDFEFFCASCGRAKHKTTGKLIPLILNYGQRKIAGDLEEMRLANLPIEMVLDKSRQFGGSTVIEHYISWVILFHKRNWDAYVVALDLGQANNIRQMFEDIISQFPSDIQQFTLKNFGGMKNTRFLHERNCRITVGSSNKPDSLRSYSGFAMHLSECSSWQSSAKISAEALAQSLWAIVPRVAYAIRILESTAKGTGNFFHKEFLSASQKDSGRKATFVAWFEIVFYNKFEFDDDGNIERDSLGYPKTKIKNYEKFISTLTDYEKWQWEQGATLEGIAWYREEKRIKNYSDFQMKSEYPTTAEESFQSYSHTVFEPLLRTRARSNCIEPSFTGDITADSVIQKNALMNIRLVENSNGNFLIWKYPEIFNDIKITNRYLVVVDIGGLSHKSDYSVISVFDRIFVGDQRGALEVVARWRGHIDHDILAWKAAQIATFYENALLAIESNTIDSRDKKSEITYEGNHFYTVIDEIAEDYSNMYVRSVETPDNLQTSKTVKYGFHTNKNTKYAAYDEARTAIREDRFIEYDNRAVDEMETLQYNQKGQIESAAGYHDDIIDTDAIGIYISEKEMDNPKLLKRNEQTTVSIDPMTGMPY